MCSFPYFLMTKALANPNQHLVKDKHLLEKLGRDQNSGPHFCRQTRTQRSKKLKKSKVKTIFGGLSTRFRYKLQLFLEPKSIKSIF